MAGSTAKRLTSLATLTKREARSNLGGDVVNKLANHLDVVTRHDHLCRGVFGALRPAQLESDIGRAHKELWLIILNERSIATTLIFCQNL